MQARLGRSPEAAGRGGVGEAAEAVKEEGLGSDVAKGL